MYYLVGVEGKKLDTSCVGVSNHIISSDKDGDIFILLNKDTFMEERVYACELRVLCSRHEIACCVEACDMYIIDVITPDDAVLLSKIRFVESINVFFGEMRDETVRLKAYNNMLMRCSFCRIVRGEYYKFANVLTSDKARQLAVKNVQYELNYGRDILDVGSSNILKALKDEYMRRRGGSVFFDSNKFAIGVNEYTDSTCYKSNDCVIIYEYDPKLNLELL